MIMPSISTTSYPFLGASYSVEELASIGSYTKKINDIAELPESEFKEKLETTCWICGNDVFSGKTCSDCFAKGLNTPNEHAAIAAKRTLRNPRKQRDSYLEDVTTSPLDINTGTYWDTAQPTRYTSTSTLGTYIEPYSLSGTSGGFGNTTSLDYYSQYGIPKTCAIKRTDYDGEILEVNGLVKNENFDDFLSVMRGNEKLSSLCTTHSSKFTLSVEVTMKFIPQPFNASFI